jgi:DNA uptake protein ComE-like DNA-binding protein
MKNRLISISLLVAFLSLGSASFSVHAAAAAAQAAASQVKASAPKSKPASKAAAKVKRLDINTASVAELTSLPNITPAEAAKIVAGRPYGSKAWLVTRGAIPEAKYAAISDLVVAKQPFRDASKNVEALKKAQKPASK